MFAEAKPTRIAATTELLRNWSKDPEVIAAAIEYGTAHPLMKSGVINTLVFLKAVPTIVLSDFAQELLPFLNGVRANGPQTEGLVAEIESKIFSG